MRVKKQGLVVVMVLASTLLSIGSVGCKQGSDDGEDTVLDKLRDKTAYQTYFSHYPFGGQTAEWWRDSLDSFGPGGEREDAGRYQLTKTRAAAVGLIVKGEQKPHDVTIDNAIIDDILKRIGVAR